MVRKGTKVRGAGATVAVAVAALVAVAGCGSSSTSASGTTSSASTSSSGGGGGGAASGVPGITSTTITLGQLADVSGPIPGLFQGAVDGMDAWAAYVNSTGGINGRKVVIDHKDSALNCTTYTNALKGMVSSVFANVGSYSVVDACGTQTLKANPDFADIEGAVINPSIDAFPNVFSPIAMPPGYETTGYQWVKDTYGTGAIQKAADLYGVAEVTAYQQEKHAAEAIGYKYVYTRGLGQTETNFTSDILRMKSDGVQVVDMIGTNVTVMADFFQQAAQQDFHPKAVINETSYDTTFFKLVGNPSYVTNLVMPLDYAMYLGEDSASVPEIKTLTTWFHKTHPKDPLNLFVLDDWAAGLLFQQAMTKAGTNPTRESFLTALREVNSFNADGLLPPGNPGGKVPPHCVVVATVKDGKYVRVNPPTQGFDCNGTFVPYSLSGS